jgi:hypothetical protein
MTPASEPGIKASTAKASGLVRAWHRRPMPNTCDQRQRRASRFAIADLETNSALVFSSAFGPASRVKQLDGDGSGANSPRHKDILLP